MKQLFPVLVAAAILRSSLALAAAPDHEPQKLTNTRFSYPTWLPDGQHVLYESSVSGDWEIYVMDLEGLGHNGGRITQLTDNDSLDRMPSISPDGRHIAFISDRDGDFEVFRMKADGSDPVQLTYDEVPQIHPYWTPDGQHIVYNTRVGDQRLYAIWIMRLDGSRQELLLQDNELNSYAQVSPDGRQIVFDKWQGNDENNGEIYVLDRGSGELHRLTSNEGIYDGYPTWTRSGRRIIYASEVGDDFKLFSVWPDGSNRRQLTFGPGSDARPSVSPDNRRLLFNREVDGNVNIMLMPLPEAAVGEP